MEVTVERLHNGRYQVVEWCDDSFQVIWEGTSGAFARRRAERHLLDALAACGEAYCEDVQGR